MAGPRILVVGSSNTDMVVISERIPRAGETVTGGRFVMAAGGKGANQAVAAARLGAEVTFIAKVGDDVFGRQAVDNYRNDGLRTDWIRFDAEHATGVALILVDAQGENLISVASGANFALGPDDIEQSTEAFSQQDILMLQLETPAETVQAAAQLAAERQVAVILNPAPAPAEPLPRELLKHVTYLTPNETEAARLTGIEVCDEAAARAAAERLLAAGVQHVVMTLGARGALWADRNGSGLVASVAIEAVDTTAAGDAFNGALGCALARGMALPEAVREACLAGALAATREGAQPSLPTRAELDAFVRRHA
ncbi:MAG: ribokinase [Planctomycetota bacterium]